MIRIKKTSDNKKQKFSEFAKLSIMQLQAIKGGENFPDISGEYKSKV